MKNRPVSDRMRTGIRETDMENKKAKPAAHRTREGASKSRKTEDKNFASQKGRIGSTERKEKPFEKFYKKEKPLDRIEREILKKSETPSHRGEIFTERFSTGKQRTYFFNVKENRLGDIYLNIVESKESESSLGFDRHQIVVFKEDLQEFLQVLNRSIDAMQNPDKKRVKVIKKK